MATDDRYSLNWPSWPQAAVKRPNRYFELGRLGLPEIPPSISQQDMYQALQQLDPSHIAHTLPVNPGVPPSNLPPLPSRGWPNTYGPVPGSMCYLADPVQIGRCVDPWNCTYPSADSPSTGAGLVSGQIDIQNRDRATQAALDKYRQMYPYLPPEQLQFRLAGTTRYPGHDWRPQYIDVPTGNPNLPNTYGPSYLKRYFIYGDDPLPPEFIDPAHPPINQDGVVNGLPSPLAPNAPGSIGQVLEAAFYLFYPWGRFNTGGSTPGRMRQGLTKGTWIKNGDNSYFPYAYWLKLVSKEMVDFATQFMLSGGFGPQAQSNFTAAGAFLLVQGSTTAGLSIAGPWGAAIGAAVGIVADLFNWGDPDPPAWFQKLQQIEAISDKTGGIYWIRGSASSEGDPECRRMIVEKESDYTILEAYAEVLRRLGKTVPPSQLPKPPSPPFPWKWVAIGVGALAVIGGGALLLSKPAPKTA